MLPGLHKFAATVPPGMMRADGLFTGNGRCIHSELDFDAWLELQHETRTRLAARRPALPASPSPGGFKLTKPARPPKPKAPPALPHRRELTRAEAGRVAAVLGELLGAGGAKVGPVARKIGIAHATFARLTAGDRPPRHIEAPTLEKIAGAAGRTLAELLAGEAPPRKAPPAPPRRAPDLCELTRTQAGRVAAAVAELLHANGPKVGAVARTERALGISRTTLARLTAADRPRYVGRLVLEKIAQARALTVEALLAGEGVQGEAPSRRRRHRAERRRAA